MELAIETSSSTASPFTSVSFFMGGFLPQHLKIGISQMYSIYHFKTRTYYIR